MSRQDSEPVEEQTINVQAGPEPKSAHRKTNGLTCPHCNAKFNRTAHLRRHQMTHRGEKPHTCMYCSVASSRKDVIIRHIRNFHPEVANSQTDSISRGSRRAINNSASSATNTRYAGTVPASPPITSETSQENGQVEELKRSGPPNGSHGCAEPVDVVSRSDNLEGRLDPCIVSLAEPLPGYLQDDPLAFLDSFDNNLGLPNADLNEIMDMNMFLFDAEQLMPGLASDLTDQSSISAHTSPTSASPDKDDGNNGSSRTNAPPTPPPDEDERAAALAKLTNYPPQLLKSLRFPSKFTVRRFVRVFFKHISPHIPIIHEPTFSIPLAPSPLLLAMLACGATFLGEHATAASMYSVAMRLMFEHDRSEVHGKLDGETQLWMLQTFLLLSYLGLHCGMEHWAVYVYPNSIKRAHDVLAQVRKYPITTYKEWVQQESVNRCLASTILIGAAPGSREREQCFVTPVVDERFALASSTRDWLSDEASWSPPCEEAFFIDDAINYVLAGQVPAQPVSEVGLVTIVSTILYRVCSFEAFTNSHHKELYTTFIEKMDRSVQVLDEMLQRRLVQAKPGMLPDPTMQCAKSLLNSVYYHLYGSISLATMKKFLCSAASPPNPRDMPNLLDEVSSPYLHKALIRAADQLRFDCQLGLEYLRRVIPHEFGPECAMATYEGSLLLYWYLEFAQPLVPQLELRDTLRALIDEGFAEVEDLQTQLQGHIAVIPLAFTSELLSDKSMWQWPSSLSQRLGRLIKNAQAG
ncbi:hypothetical protein B0T11DRAFT_324756 [Plectosphaerella cucumerina]|uniref:C2H2-type domain-containing protein n=1 Tax=Plectosphaerella cucumerina TaxID=40658 RepID=A0A8K0TRN6_9PEZI|nr:hypothetical protein B0T11DRAFT_324756 [Plectosphaerella cucumerina]